MMEILYKCQVYMILYFMEINFIIIRLLTDLTDKWTVKVD